MSTSLLAAAEALPLIPPTAVAALGRLMIVAPHPDDESLGCGGLIALARRASLPVRVLFMTDGTQSHPNSLLFPAPLLQAIRESEASAALDVLGVPPDDTIFLAWRDLGGLPSPEEPGFLAAVDRCARELLAFAPSTLVLPWRRDPHPDHRASTTLMRSAVRLSQLSPRLLEYPIWSWEQGGDPTTDEVAAWRLDVAETLETKCAAIAQHRSQTSDLISDDPDGFRLTAETRSFFERPWELYLEEMA